MILASTALNSVVAPDLLPQFLATLGEVSHQPGFSGTSVLSAVDAGLREAHVGAGSTPLAIAFAVHMVYLLLAMAFGAAVLWSRAPADLHKALLFAFMGALLASPRLIEYDMALVAIPFLVFLRDLVRDRGLGLSIAVAGLVAALVLVRTPLADWGGFVTLLGVWIGMGMTWLMGPQSESSRAPA
jgi:hypothetical protein